ncbi:uncharacterized protein DS421_19g655530 [Arachis hypogaea]|uniref:Uncharacterized protein n=1 Tax=Arachis hypogaea TaxID=3818 RepID=A0A6B9VC29_ARAHY|nr:uncharacterized protein DS421_19g655530 [Arachis hypogaea]
MLKALDPFSTLASWFKGLLAFSACFFSFSFFSFFCIKFFSFLQAFHCFFLLQESIYDFSDYQ